MLYYSLGLSAALLLLVNRAVASQRLVIPKTLALGFVFSFLPTCLFALFPAVMLQALLLCLLLLVLIIPHRGRRLYLPLSCIASVAANGILVKPAVENRQQNVRLRQAFPMESLEDRLPKKTGIASPTPDSVGLASLETQLDEAAGRYPYNSRAAGLKQLHESSVNDFVNSAGFGVGRMGMINRGRTDEESLKNGLRDEQPIPQPDYLDPFVPPRDDLSAEVPGWPSGKMRSLHEQGVIDFLNPRGFGYVKSRQEVAGFQSHGMSKAPESSESWKMARIELIGVLVHDEPVAYLSTNLPKMSELRSAPTRPLDAFETAALAKLKDGDDLFVRGTPDKARMVGAIRATKQCLECHGGNRGDLLGAFSYGFRRELR